VTRTQALTRDCLKGKHEFLDELRAGTDWQDIPVVITAKELTD
jgi:hypothetical protein